MPKSTGKIQALKDAGYEACAMLAYCKRGRDGFAHIDLSKKEWAFSQFAPHYREGDLSAGSSDWVYGPVDPTDPISDTIAMLEAKLSGPDPGVPTDTLIAQWMEAHP